MITDQFEIQADIRDLLRFIHHYETVATDKGGEFLNGLAGQIPLSAMPSPLTSG